MNTLIIDRDLTQQAPHSPRDRIAGFAIASRAIDKCRAGLAGKSGEYHYDCALDNRLFRFKGITSEQFKTVAQASADYETVGDWLLAHGTARTPGEIQAWSDQMDVSAPMKNPARRAYLVDHFGLNPATNTLFDWLEADDRAHFKPSPPEDSDKKPADGTEPLRSDPEFSHTDPLMPLFLRPSFFQQLAPMPLRNLVHKLFSTLRS